MVSGRSLIFINKNGGRGILASFHSPSRAVHAMSNHHDIRDPLIGHRFIQRSAFGARWSHAHESELDNSDNSSPIQCWATQRWYPQHSLWQQCQTGWLHLLMQPRLRSNRHELHALPMPVAAMYLQAQTNSNPSAKLLMLTHLTGHHRKIAIKMLLHFDRDVEVVARSNVEHSHCWVIIPLSHDYTIILIEIYITMPLFPSKSYNVPISYTPGVESHYQLLTITYQS